MPQQISMNRLRRRSLFIATPMYDGLANSNYIASVNHLTRLLVQYGIPHIIHYIGNESLIQRARNYCAEEFMRSGMSHMLFIDADIGFAAESVLDLIAIADPQSQYLVLTGAYPKKTIAWEKARAAVTRGLVDKNPNDLEKFVGDFVLNLPPGQQEIRLNEPFPVLEAGTGFMLVQRRAFEMFADRFPDLYYFPDHARTPGFEGSKQIVSYFHCEIDRGTPETDWLALVREAAEGVDIRKKAREFVSREKTATKRYLSEDYFFCQRARMAGVGIFMCPWIKLSHSGRYVFDANLIDMLQSGMSPTYDPEMFK